MAVFKGWRNDGRLKTLYCGGAKLKIQFLAYSFGRGFSLVPWLYLLIVGIIMLKADKGSQLNDLLKKS